LNPVNGLVYGYGGIKLLPTTMTINMDITNVDMTTGISKNFTAVPIVASPTNFNTDPFNTWKSAFRECVKLASKVIDDSAETIERLDVWCNVANGSYANCAIEGAIAGRHYGEYHQGDKEALSKINDFDWLKRKFDDSF
jgi:hypothetical protein